jgi:hypothetical protein
VDDLAERAVILAQHLHYLLRFGRFGKRSEAAQIAEDNRHIAAVAL